MTIWPENKFPAPALLLILLLAGCPLRTTSPDTLVVVPASDATPPNGIAMDIMDPDIISFGASSPPRTIIAVSDVVSVIGSARDEDGGIKALKMWATYTYFKPGQTTGPGLVSAPVTQSLSNSAVGESTLKTRTVAYNFNLKNELAGWSSIKLDVWVEGENFYAGKVQTPVVSVTYPTRQSGDTDYMAFCRKQRVPVPPDFALSGTQWVLQGPLQTNLLAPGQAAHVWTYRDPVRRGACIALPRGGSGERAGLSGIICQSATTGRACFWDSRERDDANPLREMPTIDWTRQTLRIAKLKDGSNLTEPGSGICTDCHRGNNAFLISPDDPIWGNVLRGSLPISVGSTFTTKVERSDDTQGGHPRYIPVTFPAGRPDWVNKFNANAGCGGMCHENPIYEKPFGTPSMPPACAVGGDVEECYK